MRPERALITGGGGQLASDLEAQLGEQATVFAPARTELDITDDLAVADVFSNFGPTLVFNCAAFHNVELCEREQDSAYAVNARAVSHLAKRCTDHGAKLVHVSTNYVFDGTAPDPYTEDDIPSPRSIYAISKLAGEHAALAYTDALVIRTAGLYGLCGSASKGGNFVVRMVGRASEQGSLEVVDDQFLTPTFTADLASAVLDAVAAGVTGRLHLTNAGATTWHGFTAAIMELAGLDIPVAAAATKRSRDSADRPPNGLLRSVIGRRAGLPPLRGWREALADYMRQADLLALPVPAWTAVGAR